jgi:hypothetical protein
LLVLFNGGHSWEIKIKVKALSSQGERKRCGLNQAVVRAQQNAGVKPGLGKGTCEACT